MMKKLLSKTAIMTAGATLSLALIQVEVAQAASFTFSYAFNNVLGSLDGTFDGDLNGNIIDNISKFDVTFSDSSGTTTPFNQLESTSIATLDGLAPINLTGSDSLGVSLFGITSTQAFVAIPNPSPGITIIQGYNPDNFVISQQPPTQSVPEPGTVGALAMLSLAGIGAGIKKRKASK